MPKIWRNFKWNRKSNSACADTGFSISAFPTLYKPVKNRYDVTKQRKKRMIPCVNLPLEKTTPDSGWIGL